LKRNIFNKNRLKHERNGKQVFCPSWLCSPLCGAAVRSVSTVNGERWHGKDCCVLCRFSVVKLWLAYLGKSKGNAAMGVGSRRESVRHSGSRFRTLKFTLHARLVCSLLYLDNVQFRINKVSWITYRLNSGWCSSKRQSLRTDRV
jgi:hypothetical protein